MNPQRNQNELRQLITNIPRYGEWADERNLSIYLESAATLSGVGLTDQEILVIFTALFKAAGDEREAQASKNC